MGLLLAIVTVLAVVSYATLGALVLGTGFRPAIDDTHVVRVLPGGVTVEADHVVHGDAAEDEVLERGAVRREPQSWQSPEPASSVAPVSSTNVHRYPPGSSSSFRTPKCWSSWCSLLARGVPMS